MSLTYRMFLARRRIHCALALVIAIVSLSWLGNSASAQTLFYDNFEGPTLDPNWVAAFPANVPLQTTPSLAYAGASQYTFPNPATEPSFLQGTSVIQLNNVLSPNERVGWTTNSVFNSTQVLYEVRFNTLVQSPTQGIDGLIELSIMDANLSKSLIDTFGPFSSSDALGHNFIWQSTIDKNSNFFQDFTPSYSNNTWYRLELTGSTTQNLTAALLTDGGAVIASHTFAHNLTAFPDGFRIGLTQVMGSPPTASPAEVAIDNLTVAVPEPSTAFLLGLGAVSLLALRRFRRRR